MFVESMLAAVLIAAPALVQQTDPAIKDFEQRVERYWDLHEKIADSAPPIDKKKEPDPAVIIAHERAVADGIRAARKQAAEGDIFTPAAAKILKATIQRELSPKRQDARDMVLGEGNPKNPESKKTEVVLAVNAKYPSSAPLSAIPPRLLLKLPKLPRGVEYRFVGKNLILFDSKANLIVDILRNAVR